MRPEDQVFEFANFVLVPKERLLLCGGKPVPLSGKAFDLLVALARRSGHLVSKDELMNEVWPDTFVQEVNLTVNISALRKALGAGDSRNRLIQTVPAHGYRFVPPVTTRNAAAEQVPASGRPSRAPAQPPTENADAYRAYLQGRHDWNRRTEEGLKRAIESFQSAVDADPRFSAAYSGIADSHAALGYLSHVAPADAFPMAARYATKALELDSSRAEAHASLGFAKLYFEWDWGGAEAEFRRAITLDPDYAAAHDWYSIYLLAAGRSDEAWREVEFAHRRDPLSVPINTDLGFHYYYTGRYNEAVKQLKFVLQVNDFPLAHLWLGRTYQELGRFDDALTAFRRVEENLHEWPVSMAARGFVAGMAGRTDEARAVLADLERLAGKKFVTSYGMALVHAGLRDNDGAFAWLNRSFDERSHWLVWLRLDPRWNGLRSDARFADLVKSMRYPQRETLPMP
jgi:DNA-binding winged helix-turn-helix (wHTH) protein/Flp pilus assembly protein TadD